MIIYDFKVENKTDSLLFVSYNLVPDDSTFVDALFPNRVDSFYQVQWADMVSVDSLGPYIFKSFTIKNKNGRLVKNLKDMSIWNEIRNIKTKRGLIYGNIKYSYTINKIDLR